MNDDNLDIIVTVKFTCENMVDKETLMNEYGNDPLLLMRDMILDDSIFSFVSDSGELISASIADE